MVEEFDLQKIKNQYPEFFQEASNKLIELATSQETASQIAEICLKNRIEEEQKIEKIAYYISFVLLSQLPPGTLPKALEKNLPLKPEIAKKISEEVNQLIFAPVKDDLTELYKEIDSEGIEDLTPALSEEKPKKSPPLPTETPVKTGLSEEKAKRPPKKDAYREPVE